MKNVFLGSILITALVAAGCGSQLVEFVEDVDPAPKQCDCEDDAGPGPSGKGSSEDTDASNDGSSNEDSSSEDVDSGDGDVDSGDGDVDSGVPTDPPVCGGAPITCGYKNHGKCVSACARKCKKPVNGACSHAKTCFRECKAVCYCVKDYCKKKDKCEKNDDDDNHDHDNDDD